MNIIDKEKVISISYSVLVHNETESLKNLIEVLIKHLQEFDEIVIVDDFSDNPITMELLKDYDSYGNISVYQNALNGDFSQQKNFATSKCNKEYIFNVDADEVPSEHLLKSIHEILLYNQEVEVYRVPRLNKVDGITMDHINKWRWRISTLPDEVSQEPTNMDIEKYKFLRLYNLIIHDSRTVEGDTENVIRYYNPIINYPDWQYRLYKNDPKIKWVNKVHEVIVGFRKVANLPMEKRYCLLHNKDIKRQESQNNFYDNMIGG